jgi:hypothetical protein
MTKIELSNGGFAIIDDCDFELVSGFRWHKNVQGYAGANAKINGNRTVIMMHRLIMGANPKQLIDHINHNTLDNTRTNLRLCTHAENMKNRLVCRSSSTGLKGTFPNGSGKFRARIVVDGRRIWLGTFLSPADAHAAYCTAAKKYHGEFANSGVRT